jgi:RNA polymerase sigma-70 factor (ECF subfamily)
MHPISGLVRYVAQSLNANLTWPSPQNFWLWQTPTSPVPPFSCPEQDVARAENVSEESPAAKETELLRLIGEGDRQAFSSLYDQYSGILFSILLRMLNDRHEAEDVLQEAFVQIWENASRFNPKLGKPLSWALTVARNKAIDRLRASQRRFALSDENPPVEDSAAVSTATAADCALQDERAVLIRSAMADLPKEQRQAIELAFFSGLSQNEIAATLAEPLGTIKARIRRGMLKLREVLEHEIV